MSRWIVYMLRCSDGSLYTGITKDLEKRLVVHNAGKGAKYTRSRGPVVVVWSEKKRTEGAARKREAALKGLTKQEKERLVSERGTMGTVGTVD